MTKRIALTVLLWLGVASAWALESNVEFANTPLSVSESAGSITIQVNRIDAGEGLVTYSYFLEGITASPGSGGDYLDTSGELTWENGDVAPKSFNIEILDNNDLDGDRELQIFLQNQFGSGEPLFTTLTILDNEVPDVVEFQLGGIRVHENSQVAEVTVVRTGSGVGAVFVPYSTFSGTATAGEDFEEASDVLVWEDGITGPRTISVVILPGQIAADGERFTIALLEPDGPVVLGSRFIVEVLIEPFAGGQLAFANTPLTVAENAGIATIVVNREGGSDGVIVAEYYLEGAPEGGTAVEGVDFTDVTGQLVWQEGDSAPKSFEIPIIDNQAADGDRTFFVSLLPLDQSSGPINEPLTILDDDQPSVVQFAVTDLQVEEDAGTLLATVVRTGSSGGAVSVSYRTEDGTAVSGEDYEAAEGQLSWADGETGERTIEVTILPGQIAEAGEDFNIRLLALSGPATLGPGVVATVTIGPLPQERDISTITVLNPNQRALATWFDSTCPRLDDAEVLTPDQQDLADICGLVRGVDLDDQEVREILDAINPDEIFAAATSALRLTVSQHGNLSQRLNALRSGARGIDLSGLNLEIDGQTVAGTAIQEVFNKLIGGGASGDDEALWGRWGAFVNGRFSTGRKDGTEAEAGFNFDLYSVTLGVDYRIRPNLIFGVAAGFGGVDSKYRGDGGKLEIESWNTSAFLTYFTDDKFYADLLATYGRNDYDSKRNIIFGSESEELNRVARGDTRGSQYSLGFGLGWDFSRGAWTYGPHAGAYFYDVDVDGFDEQGAGGLNLGIGSQSVRSLTANAGGHVSYALLTNWGVLIPNARVDWVREFEDGSEALSYRFLNDPFSGDPDDPSPVITLRSDRPDNSFMIWSAGVSAQFIHGFSGFVNYQTYTGYDSFSINEWNLGLRWEKTY